MKSSFLKLNTNNQGGISWSVPPPPKKEKIHFSQKSPIIKHIEREIIRKHGDNKFTEDGEDFYNFKLDKK